MTQTLAIFYDAYRELNAKKMFWVVLVLSGLVVAVFAGVGVNGGQITFLGLRTPIPLFVPKATMYKVMFSALGVGFWLTWIAMALALISTASIFPDFITGGSIDLYLSKPLGRLRLFLTKYAAGLLFVALQVFVFCLASFVTLGARAGVWDAKLFLAVPLVVCVFSYLFCVQVLFGLLTRSTIASVLLTILFWFLVWGVDKAEIVLLTFKVVGQHAAKAQETSFQVMDGQVQYQEKQGREDAASLEYLATLRAQRQQHANALADARAKTRNMEVAHNILYGIKTVFPKTRETNELLDRALLTPEEAEDLNEGRREQREARRQKKDRGPFDPDEATIHELSQELNTRPPRWIIGSSLVFEAAVLSLAAWVFCRRDY